MNSSKVNVKRKPICETATEDDVLSYDDFSVSPGSSLSSFQEMDLYDIPENSEAASSNSMQRPRSAPRYGAQRMRSKSAPAHSQPKHVSNLNGTSFNSHEDENAFSRSLDKKTELLLVRSKTSSDGFVHHSSFNRNDSARMTVPARKKYQNNPNLSDSSVNSKLHREQKQNGVREKNQHQNGFKKDDKVNLSNSTVLSNMTSSSLRRSKSLKVPKSPYPIPVVPSTRSSELRLSKTRLESNYKTKNFNDELNESDNSYTTSECDSPFLTTGKKGNPVINGYGNVIVNGGNTKNTQKCFNSCCSGSQCNGRSEIKLACSPIMNVDGFSLKLSEVCNLITEKHPGEFQIIERLVEMQSAYEDCSNSINETIAQLQQRIVELECKQNVGITSLAIPLMHATSAFQSQIQDIINRKYFTTDFSVQVCNGQTQNSPLDEISNEANAVAAHIASLCLHKENEPRDQ